MWKIGQIIDDQYTVLDIKQGGMGTVYIVRGQHQIYAVKTLQDRFLELPGWKEQFEQEAYTWLRLGAYEHIVRAYFVNRFDDQPYVFSDAILTHSGPNNLRGWIAFGALSPLQVALFGVQFCKGMEYARHKGLMGHFDIKPENVMIEESGLLKITDWGLARLQSSAMQPPGKVLSSSKYNFHLPEEEPSRGGTLPYMAPEIFSGAAITKQVDLYAFGIMLYEMATGRYPFRAHNYLQIKTFHLQETPVSPRQITPRLPISISQLIMQCLEKQPENRPADFREPMDVLARFIKNETGENISLDIQSENLTGADSIQAAMGMHVLGRDDEAMRLMENGDSKAGVVMWDDREHGFSISISPQQFKDAQYQLVSNPDDPKPWQTIGLFYSVAEEYNQAIEHYQRALQALPEHAAQWQQSIADAKKSKNHLLVEELIEKGDGLANAGQHLQAQAIFQQAIELDSEHAMAWYDLGVCQMSLGDLQNALLSITQAVALDDELVQAWSNRGALLMQLGMLPEALASLEKACQIDPKHAKAWLNRGGVLQMMERTEDALGCFKQALTIDPHYTKAQQAHQILLKQMKKGGDPVQEAFNAFQLAGSLDAMRRAVEQHSLLADERAQKAFEKIINEQVPRHQQAVFKQRLEWLHQATQRKKKGWFR